MGAPFGNKNGKGHGRPPEYNMYEEAQALDLWSKKETSISLNQFINERDLCPEYLSAFAKKDDYFSKTLKKAKSRIAERREQLVNENKLNYGIHQRTIGMYDSLLQEYERGEKAYEASLKQATEAQFTPEHLKQMADMFAFLKKAQSACSINESKESKEIKS